MADENEKVQLAKQFGALRSIWLDDVRPEPEGFLRSTTARSCIARLDFFHRANVQVEHLSLDHDLGENENEVGNGYDVVCWIEERVFTDPTYVPPKLITVHSDNASSRLKMLAGIKAIQKQMEQRGGTRK